MKSFTTLFTLLVLVGGAFSSAESAPARGPLELTEVLAVDTVASARGLHPAADLLSLGLYRRVNDGSSVLRLSFLSLGGEVPELLRRSLVQYGDDFQVGITVTAGQEKSAGTVVADFVLGQERTRFRPELGDKSRSGSVWSDEADPDAVFLVLPGDLVATATVANPVRLTVATTPLGSGFTGDLVSASFPADKAYEAHCALVLHGNQGIGYSDVFHGRSDDLAGSGFDEALEAHQTNSVPGNFHMSGTLQASAEWAARNGDPTDFNAWLATGVTAGWAGMLTSAYGQHIMPFVNNEMNDWAVNIQTQMTNTRYGYFPTVAWIPERVWLNTTGYPSSGVNDWIGDNWQSHGVQGVILDDDVHLTGHDNHQIHTLAANGLRLIPRDRSFTGNIVGGNGQASLDILTGLAGSGVGEFRIAVFAEDWEAVAEMGGWAGVVPNAKETYDWFIGKCNTESSWLSTWKLADALGNPDFNGSSISITPGTYNEIGGFDGYGGGDNGWYGHWAGWIPWANGGDGNGSCRNDGIGNCKNYGTLWNEAYSALLGAPDNNVSQAGWYVLMTNLHETAWHDGMGGPISGWQHNYSAHIKNAMIYAEASHWANGEYALTTNAYLSDIDNDGYSEAILHNDHLFAVFRGAGGRLTNLFVKGPGYDDTAIGIDNAYWSDTNADYNDPNHVGAFSDVSPNYQNELYDVVLNAAGSTVSVEFSLNEVTKEITLIEGDSFFDVVYRVGPATHWLQSGFSPSLVDLTWNAELDRVWPTADGAYMGQRNPNTGLAAAFVIGSGGATHQKEFSGTLSKGDELYGNGVFQFKLFAGPTTAPDGSGDIPELRALVAGTTDTIGPAVTAATYFPATDRLQVIFDQNVATASPAGFTVVDGLGAASSVSLPGATPISETSASVTRTFELDGATAATLDGMTGPLYLEVSAGAVTDQNAVAGPALVLADEREVAVITTTIAIDGNIEPGEWTSAQALADSNDSAWTAANEIDRLLVHWDATYLYLAIDGQVDANSWLLYLDVDPGSVNGQTDLTATDAWERGATFSATDFAADFQYGCYQHQSVYDGDGFWELLSATTTQDRSGEIQSAFDAYHTFGDASGSEIAIPWNTLYGLGAGVVPANAEIALVASICWDPEPSGELGGDSVPSNLVAALPVLDNAWTVTVDANGDGAPDLGPASSTPDILPRAAVLLPNYPNPFNPRTSIGFEITGASPVAVDLEIFDMRGRRIATLVTAVFEPGRHVAIWNGISDSGLPAAAGTYFSRLHSSGLVQTRSLSLVK